MASLTDLFNPTFLMFLGILLLAIALLALYFESKFRDQNHKIASMLSLVSSLAEELNSNKMMVNHLSMMGAGNLQSVTSQNISNQHEKPNPTRAPNPELINVSDDDTDDDDEDDDKEDEDSDDDDDDDDNDTTDSDNEKTNNFTLEENNVIQIGESLGVKVLKINIGEYNDDIDDDEVENDLDSNVDDLDEQAGSDSASSKSELEGNNTEEFVSLEHNNAAELETIDFNNSSFTEEKVSLFDLKSINMPSLEEESKEILDFKKMSIPKLRSIVNERGLSTETAKLKKSELLKLLEVE